MVIYQLIVNDPAGKIVNFFEHEEDARRTYSETYSKVQDKPTWRVEKHEVLTTWTHL